MKMGKRTKKTMGQRVDGEKYEREKRGGVTA